MPAKSHFSTEMLPPGMSDDAKAGFVYDMISAGGYPMDARRDDSRPFWGTFEQMAAGRLELARTAGTSLSSTRTARHLRHTTGNMYRLFINRSGSLTGFEGPGGDTGLQRDDVILFASEMPGTLHMTSGASLEFVTIPGEMLAGRLPGGSSVPHSHVQSAAAADMLARYFDLVWSTPHEFGPELAAHVESTLLDLMVIALGRGGEEEVRGLRHARAADLVARIRAGYADPGFSVTALAKQAGLTPRYVSMLLAETGKGFTERVNDLRLDRAVQMLSDPAARTMRISEIAFACGFNDISHFNRCFRRRFGCTPGAMR